MWDECEDTDAFDTVILQANPSVPGNLELSSFSLTLNDVELVDLELADPTPIIGLIPLDFSSVIAAVADGVNPAVAYEDLGEVVQPGFFVSQLMRNHSVLFIGWVDDDGDPTEFDPTADYNIMRTISGNQSHRVLVHDYTISPNLFYQHGKHLELTDIFYNDWVIGDFRYDFIGDAGLDAER